MRQREKEGRERSERVRHWLGRPKSGQGGRSGLRRGRLGERERAEDEEEMGGGGGLLCGPREWGGEWRPVGLFSIFQILFYFPKLVFDLFE